MTRFPENEASAQYPSSERTGIFSWLDGQRHAAIAIDNILMCEELLPELIDKGYIYFDIPEVQTFFNELSEGKNHLDEVDSFQRSIIEYVVHPDADKTSLLRSNLLQDYPKYVVQYFTRPSDHIAEFHMRVMIEAYVAMAGKTICDRSEVNPSLNLHHSLKALQKRLHDRFVSSIPDTAIEQVREEALTVPYNLNQVLSDDYIVLKDKAAEMTSIDSLKTLDYSSFPHSFAKFFYYDEIGDLDIDADYSEVMNSIRRFINNPDYYYAALRAFEINVEREDLKDPKAFRMLLANEKNNSENYIKYLHLITRSDESDNRNKRVQTLAKKLYKIPELGISEKDAIRLIEELLPLLGYTITNKLYESSKKR